MATAAKKLQSVHQEAQQDADLPVTVKIGRDAVAAPACLGELVLRGAALKRSMDVLKGQLDELNALILEDAPLFMGGAGTIQILVADVDCTVSLRDSVSIDDAGALRELLGERFPDLVKEKVSYSPEARLIAMATDADSPLAKPIAACLRIQEAKATISYKTV